MRMAFGLLGLLVTVGVIVWLWSQPGAHPADTVKRGQDAEKQVRAATVGPKLHFTKMAGGMAVAGPSDSSEDALGAAFDLKTNDVVTATSTGPLPDDESLAMNMIQAERQQLTIRRDGQPMILTPGQPARPVGAPANNVPQPPTDRPPSIRDKINDLGKDMNRTEP